MEYQNFDCEIAEGYASVRLIGPGAPTLADLNDEFMDLMLRLQEDRAVRAILFTDGDHAFELHHNLDLVADTRASGGGLEVLAVAEEISRNIVTMFNESIKPIIAASRGDVRDFGIGFYLAADIRLASSESGFTCQDMSGGLLPGWGLTHTLPKLVGPGRALDLLWSKRTVSGQEAWQIGLVDRLIDSAAWEQELDDYMQRLTHLPQPAAMLSKLAVQQAATMDQTTMLSVEWESQQQCWDSLETATGLAAWQAGHDPILGVVIADEDG